MFMICPVCGSQFEGKGAKKYCSYGCYKKARLLREFPKIEKSCPVCGKTFVPLKKNSQQFCSPKCRTHANYLKNKDAIRAANDKWHDENIERVAQRRKEYYWENVEAAREKTKQWRINNPDKYRQRNLLYHDKTRFSGNKQAVLERDNYKCVKCGAIKGINVHHKDHTGQAENRNDSLENLITLCNSCHANEHRDDLNAKRNKKVEKQCLTCGKVFEITPSRAASGRGKYCSRACQRNH